MATAITLLYPLPPPESKSTFNLKYYIENHMTMVYSKWSKIGLQKYQVVQLDPSSGYSTQCIMYWDSVESFQKAFKKDEEEVMGDVKNYSETQPVTVVGKVVDEKWKSKEMGKMCITELWFLHYTFVPIVRRESGWFMRHQLLSLMVDV